MNPPTTIDRATRIKIAAAAGCDERTVAAFLKGECKRRPYLIEAILKAAADLGVALAPKAARK